MSADGVSAIQSLRAYVEGYPQGGRIERHAHDLDQLTVITESAAIIETDDVYVVHPCMHALWLPAGVYHSIFSPRAFYLHALYLAAAKSIVDLTHAACGRQEHWRGCTLRRLR